MGLVVPVNVRVRGRCVSWKEEIRGVSTHSHSKFHRSSGVSSGGL